MSWDANGSPVPADAPATIARVPEDYCRCGCGVRLTGRQTAFASAVCNSRYYDLLHPRVNPPNLKRQDSIYQLVLGILGDGEWHSVQDLAVKSHALPCSVSARLREIRRRGHQVERDLKRGDSRRPARYRLIG